MKVSYKWLQTYFKDSLPTPEALVDLFTFHSFEIEGIEKVGDDAVIDAKILPDRAHYALSHRGIAAEVAALTALPKADPIRPPTSISKTRPLSIEVKDSSFCNRYIGRVIENLSITDSPAWLKECLTSLGARSINSVVDATNYVMFDVGQPLHAFDADKVKGSIVVRSAAQGEKITILDGKEITLSASDFVIADDEGPLAIAGVKGGKRAEVTTSTKNIIIESANFNASSVRKTSVRVGIRNDSSKRFENAITSELASLGMEEVTALIARLSPSVRVGEIVDIYPVKPVQQKIAITTAFINNTLGITLSKEDIISLLQKQNIEVAQTGEELLLTIPYERLDLVIPNDIVEEVGRLYGYEKIPALIPPASTSPLPINKEYYYIEKIKNILVALGISEVYLYSLTKNGHFEVAYPLALDKAYLRTHLTSGVMKALDLNVQNAPLLALQKIKIFEIGNVFTEKGEHTSLCVGVKYTRKFKGQTVNDEIRTIRDVLFKELNTSLQTLCTVDDTGGIITLKGEEIGTINKEDGILEMNLSLLMQALPMPSSFDISHSSLADVRFKPISVYPFISRDIAVFVPENVNESSLEAMIKPLVEVSGLLQKMYLFDMFQKTFPDGSKKTSYAFRLIFQSLERTLEDTEVNVIMDSIYAMLKEKNFEVR